jgi:uncharacterized protein (DUF1778 family)
MTSKPKVPAVNESRKGTWPVVGGRVRPEDRRTIDIAAAHEGLKRGDFIIEAALAKAREVLKRRAA